jgi:thiol-disulfide isomerase/thioredoxin
MKKFILVLSFLVALFASDSNLSSSENKLKSKSFEVESVDGKKFHFTITKQGIVCDEAKNKVLVVDFFGKNCPPCKASIPILAKINSEMSKKVAIIALHVQEKLTPQDILTLRKNLGINYPIIDMTGSEKNYEFVEFLGAMAGWQGTIPFMLFFDKLGRYRAQHYGMVDYNKLKDFLEKLYQE